ncbi:MAG TPA: hypothetical protein VN494_08585 [Patescibacteria group bacterium]|nr:hypothetical protein [Patescibacteria group bacterium]
MHMPSILDSKKAEERARFLRLSPLERAEAMHRLISSILTLKADAEGVSVYEIYQRYLRDNPRHYQRSAR